MTLEGRVLDQQTRADRVRSRRVRVQRPVEPVKRKRKANPKRRTRRRSGFAVATPRGAEIRIPSLGLRAFGARWMSLILLAGSLALLVSALGSPSFVVGTAEVGGNSFVPASQIRSAAGVEGALVFAINPEAIAAKLELLPEIRTADVSIGWTNEISIQVTERPPMVAWNDGGRLWWIGAEGIAYSPQGEDPGLIRVEAVEPYLDIQTDPTLPALSADLVDTAVALKAALPTDAALTFDAVHGFAIEDERGTQVYFGFSEDIDSKILIYQAISAALEERGQAVSVISVEDVRAPYYRWE